MCTPIDIKIKDLAKITGKSYGRAYILMQRIRVKLNKKDHHLVTPDEIADYFNIPIHKIIEKLKEKPTPTI